MNGNIYEKLITIDNIRINGLCILNINGDYKINKKDEETVLKYIINIFYKALVISRENKKKNIIINIFLENYKLDNIRRVFIITIIKILSTMYPDILYQCNMINPNSIFNEIANIIKSLLNEESRKKLVIKKM